MPSPTGQETARRNIGSSPGDAEGLPRRFLAHLPNESIIVKMEQRRRSDHSGQNPFHDIDADTRLVVTERTIGEDQPDIDAHQCSTAAEHEPHETADRSVALDSFAIVNPD